MCGLQATAAGTIGGTSGGAGGAAGATGAGLNPAALMSDTVAIFQSFQGMPATHFSYCSVLLYSCQPIRTDVCDFRYALGDSTVRWALTHNTRAPHSSLAAGHEV